MLDPAPDNRLKSTPRQHNFAGLAARWNSPRDTLRRARRYSHFVRFMKGVLPLAAFGVGAAVLFYATQHKDMSSFALTFERMGRIKDDLTMIHPRLTGTDDDGSPYTINAETAIQEDAKTMRVRLQKLDGNMTTMDGTMLHLLASEGRMDGSANTLFVYNGVRLTTADGYDVRTTAATVDMKNGIIRGNQRVAGSGPAGHLEADAFVADKTTKRAIFTGHVHMLLNPSTEAKAEEAKSGAPPHVKAIKSGAKVTKTNVADKTAPPLRASIAGSEK